jgi:hypothetical protein
MNHLKINERQSCKLLNIIMKNLIPFRTYIKIVKYERFKYYKIFCFTVAKISY